MNNDDLLTLLIGVLTAALVFVFTGTDSYRLAIAVGVLGGLALLTKGFALVVPPWVVAAYALAAVRFGDRIRLLRQAATALLIMTILGGWWWIRNVIEFGAVQPGIQLHPARPGFQPRVAWWFGRYLRAITFTFWNPAQGRGDPTLPTWLSVIAMAVLLIGVAAAFFRRDDAGSRRWADAMVLAIPALGIACIVAQGAYAEYARSSLTPGLQGRYLFPAVAGLSVLCAAGLSVLSRGRDRLLAGLVLSAAALIQVSIGIATLRAYWESPDQPSLWQGIRAVLAWSPWPSPIVMVVWASLVLAIGVLAREALRFTRENETTVD